MNANQFLQDYMKGINPISVKERTEEDVFKEMIKEQYENPSPSIDPDSLDLTVPGMAPGPYFPGQDLMRDKYIREQPRSGIAGVMGNPELVAGFNHVIGPESTKARQLRKIRDMGARGSEYEKRNAGYFLDQLGGPQLPLGKGGA